MSRVAKKPIALPKGVEATVIGDSFSVVGPKGKAELKLTAGVTMVVAGREVNVAPNDASTISNAMAGTTRALANNMVKGVSQGFEKKLQLVGVGYRAQVQGTKLNLTLGFSHPVSFEIPVGIVIETPTVAEIVVKGTDRQQVGLVAAKIRAYRPPEPYKGKGVKYAGETIVLKEAKKK